MVTCTVKLPECLNVNLSMRVSSIGLEDRRDTVMRAMAVGAIPRSLVVSW